MALTIEEWVFSLSGLAITALSYLCCVKFLARYATSRRIETLLQAIILFAIGSSWNPVISVINIINLLRGGEAIGHIPMIWSWGWTPPVIATLWMYLVITLVRPKLKTVITPLYVAINLVYLYYMYLRTTDYTGVRYVGRVPASEVSGIAAVLLFFDIVSGLAFVGPMYLYIGFKSKKPATQLRGRVIGVGVMLFAFFVIFETVIQYSVVLLVIARILIMVSILLMYIGFTLPQWVQKRFLSEETTIS